MSTNSVYQIGLSLLPGIGSVLAKNLLSYCGSVEAVFKTKKTALLKIPGIGPQLANNIINQSVLNRAEEELLFVEKHHIKPIFYTDKSYPQRLKNCNDGPILLYYKGTADLNIPYVISVVGTRKATTYGKELCEKLIAGLQPYGALIVSGLAYGIDHCAHQSALKSELPTIGVLAHGLDRIYPAQHRSLANKMLENGGLLTEFASNTNADRENFPKRNRIVAGLSDATIVIETAAKGGSLITAHLANSYHRDVFTFPGRIGDTYSEGCNQLIKKNIAALIESPEDLIYQLGWETDATQKTASKQQQLFIELSPQEQLIVNGLNETRELQIDQLYQKIPLNASQIVTHLLNLEMKGVLKMLPGNKVRLL